MPTDTYTDFKNIALDWIKHNGSGSLRRAQEENLDWFDMYVHERIAFEIATGACVVPSKDIVLNDAKAYPDTPAVTESCWYARVLRYRFSLTLHLQDIQVSVQSFFANSQDQIKIHNWPFNSGICIVLLNVPLTWIPHAQNFTVILPISFWDDHENRYTDPLNPC